MTHKSVTTLILRIAVSVVITFTIYKLHTGWDIDHEVRYNSDNTTYRNENNSSDIGWVEFTNPNVVLKIYQMLYDIDKIFTQHNISYWMGFGTLLGAVRNKGLIPWDDDADLCIFHNHITSKLTELQPFTNDLFKHGYNIKQHALGYKIFIINNTNININNCSVPFVDIWPMKAPRRHGKFNRYRYLVKWRLKCFWTPVELQFMHYKFGDIELVGPTNPFRNLNTCYGENWNVTKFQVYSHLKGVELQKIYSNITTQQRQYAMPTGPIHKW